MKPLLSVLMPTYNNVPYLARAIQSILDQTFKDFELLVLDDGSTDGAWAGWRNDAAGAASTD